MAAGEISSLADKTAACTREIHRLNRENAVEILRGADIIAGSVNRDAADVVCRASENMSATIEGYREV